MNKILVTGGSGGLGSEVVPRLLQAGYQVRIMSRRPSPDNLAAGLEWAQADLATGEGLAAAVAGVDEIIHAATVSKPMQKVAESEDVMGTEKLLRAAEAAGIAHFLFISIVGIERIPFNYYKQKVAIEKMLQASSLDWSILRAVQFHSFVALLTEMLAKLPIMLVPTDFRFQTIETGEVADNIAQGLRAGRRGYWPELAGPQVMTWGEMAQGWLTARGEKRRIVRLPVWGKLGAGFRAGYNTAPDKASGHITWEEWLQREGQASQVERRMA